MDGDEPAETAGDATADEHSPGGGLSQVRERAAAIRDGEVDRACSRLQARGDLSVEERAAIERLADRLVDRILVAPVRRVSAPGAGEEAAETVRALFED